MNATSSSPGEGQPFWKRIVELISADEHIMAVRELRARTGLGLHECHRVITALRDEMA
jgi:hypothetical protein